MTSDPTATVLPGPLTASFHGLPEAHDGSRRFAFEIRFSEEFQGMRLTALKQALEVSGGRLIDVKRTVRGQNRSVTGRVRPSTTGMLTLGLPATSDCSAADAVCTSDGRKLSAAVSAAVRITGIDDAGRAGEEAVTVPDAPWRCVDRGPHTHDSRPPALCTAGHPRAAGAEDAARGHARRDPQVLLEDRDGEPVRVLRPAFDKVGRAFRSVQPRRAG